VARHEIPVNTTLGEETDLPLETEETLYRIAQEALHNTVKHARASRADLKLVCDARVYRPGSLRRWCWLRSG
jgi:signal transduction histidine kinase